MVPSKESTVKAKAEGVEPPPPPPPPPPPIPPPPLPPVPQLLLLKVLEHEYWPLQPVQNSRPSVTARISRMRSLMVMPLLHSFVHRRTCWLRTACPVGWRSGWTGLRSHSSLDGLGCDATVR